MYRKHSSSWIAAAVVASLALAACGSQLDPETVRAANGQPADGGVPGTTGDPGAVAPGAAEPGSGSTGSTGSTRSGRGAGGSGSGSGAAADGTGAAPGSGANAASGSGKAASCAGFKNQTGMTDSKVVIANASDISGPVPGLFESAQDATKAYVAYFNATSSICGRKLDLLTLDRRTDAGADQQAYAQACDEAFAAVGSMSAFDSGGADTAAGCGLPDIRAAAVTSERSACGTCFGAQSTNVHEFQNAVPDYFLKNHHDASQHAAFLWINAGSAAQNAATQSEAMEKRGMRFAYKSGIDVAEFNYTPYVAQMKDKGIKWVQYVGSYQGAVKLAQAMQQQQFKPAVFLLDPTAYDPRFVESGGSAVDGTIVFMNFTPFEEAGSNAELRLYRQWLQQVHPGATPTFFGLFAWSATRLFVEQALALGGDLTRKRLTDRMTRVDNWTSNGLHSAQHVGSQAVGECWRFVRLDGGRWVPEGGRQYRCSGVTKVG